MTSLTAKPRFHCWLHRSTPRTQPDPVGHSSTANADHTTVKLAAEHQATEQAIVESGVPYALLRNSWYLENYTAQLPAYVGQGAVLGSAGDGGISAATRADYAEAAAAVVLSETRPARSTSSAATSRSP